MRGEVGPAFQWAPELEEVSVLCWADNIWILGSSEKDIQTKIDLIDKYASALHMTWGDDSLEVLRNDWVEDEPDATPGGALMLRDGRVFKEKERHEVLGVAIDKKGS